MADGRQLFLTLPMDTQSSLAHFPGKILHASHFTSSLTGPHVMHGHSKLYSLECPYKIYAFKTVCPEISVTFLIRGLVVRIKITKFLSLNLHKPTYYTLYLLCNHQNKFQPTFYYSLILHKSPIFPDIRYLSFTLDSAVSSHISI